MNPGNRSAWIAAFLILATAAYFRNTRPGWNVNSQFDLTLAIVERGTLKIDAYHDQPGTETEDKAYFEGHFYCDKSPVTPFLGVPALWAARIALSDAGTPHKLEVIHALRHWTTVGSIGLCAAALAFMIAHLLAIAGVEPRLAAAASALWIAATPLLGYSILFFNYVPACTFLLLGFVILRPLLTEADSTRLSPIHSLRLFLAGGMIGLACWTLQTVALLAVILTIALLQRTPRSGWVRLWPWAIGGVIGVAGYAIYSMAIFGEITSPYRHEFHEEFKVGMDKGLMGATWPSLKVLQLITVHPFRGLFVLFPCTAPALFGALWTLRDSAHRRIGGIAIAFLAGLALYNAGYYMWWGGWTYAPRHLIPALPLLALGMSAILCGPRPWNRWTVWLLGALLAYGALTNVMVIALDPQPPPGLPDELLYAPASVERWPYPFFDMLRFVARGQTDQNLGTMLGLKGAVSLLPLLGIWIAGFIGILRPSLGSKVGGGESLSG